MHFKSKNQMSEIVLLILYDSDMLISNMLVKFGHHIRISHKSNYKFFAFFISIKIFSLRYSERKANKKFIIVSNVKNLETDDSAKMFTIISWQNPGKKLN